MTDNIVATVSRFLTPEVLGKLAAATGLDTATAQKAASASVPAILGGLADLAAKPGGPRQLASAVAEQPSGLLSTLTSAIGGNTPLQERGSSLLASLLGSGTLGTLVSSVSKFAGIGEGSARSLMGLLTPVVLSVLGREQRSAGMEASGLARMLMDQKDQITAALPAGLSSMFGGMREGLGGSSPSAARIHDSPQTAYTPHRSASAEVQRAVSGTKGGPSSSWAYWALPLAALAGLLWYLLPSGHTPDSTAQTKTTSSTSTPVRMLPRLDDKSLYLTKALDGWTSIGAYHNQEIYNRAGERIGIVKDLLVGPDGKINAAVIGVGRFLGIGEKDVAVPLAALQIERRDNRGYLTMDVAKDILRAAPAFEGSSAQ